MDKKLEFELVPDSCWYSNLRSILSRKQWDYLRKNAYAEAQGKCMVCGRPCKRLEAHERWEYDDEKQVQKLVDIIAVCHDCHSVIHIGRTSLVGDYNRAQSHYMRVNSCDYATFIHDLGEANRIHQARNRIPEWKLDLSFLEKYLK